MCLRGVLALAVPALVYLFGLAQAPPDTPEQAADKALAAFQAKDAEALKALATKDSPDPWLVADELCARGEHDAAEAFARAALRKAVDRLPEYVANRRGIAPDAAARKALADARAALAAGDFAKALEVLSVTPPLADPLAAARIHFGRGFVLRELGRLEESTAAFDAAAEAYRALGGLWRESAALQEAGASAWRRSEWPEALDRWTRRLAISEELGDRAGVATTLGNIGIIHSCLGDYPKALLCQERSLALDQELKNRNGVARSLGNIGLIHESLGDRAKALSCLEQARAIMEELDDRAGVAAALGNIGILHESLEDHPKALLYMERAMVIQDALGDRAGIAMNLGNIGLIQESLGDYPKAISYLERALAMLEELGDQAGVAATLDNIGRIHDYLGDHAKALRYHERSLMLTEELGDQDGVATTLGNIGIIHSSLGDYPKALRYQERALKLMQELGDRDGVATILCHIGLIHESLCDYPKALAFARQAATGLSEVVRGLGIEEGAGAREPFGGVFDLGCRAALALKDAGALAFFLESGRAVSLLENLKSRETLWAAAVPEELRMAEAVARASVTAASAALRMALDGGDRAEIQAKREELEAAQEMVSAAISRIQREAKAGAQLVYPEVATLEEIRACLQDAEALVLFCQARTNTCALVATKDGARIVDLGATARIEEVVKATNLEDAYADPSAPLAALSDLIVVPLGLPAGTRRVLVSPSGALSYVPLAVLMPEVTVSCVPSGTTYRLLLEESEKRGEGVLALGDPDYGAKPDETAALNRGAFGQLLPLPETREEANSVGTEILLGGEATEAGLRGALPKKPRWRAVHLACHGLVDTARPVWSSLALTPGGGDDGFLTCLEVFRMKMPADLVVLSACETAKGKVVRSEGIVGLTRAFMFAGAPRVLCSLWRVDDAATKALMVKFYELWNPKEGTGLPAAEALRKAQDFIRAQEQWKDPRYWAAWTLWGLPD